MSNTALPRERESFAAQGVGREHLIKEFAHVIRAMAHRLAFRLPAYLDAEDLISVGTIGLMDAMDKYDPHPGSEVQDVRGIQNPRSHAR